MSTECRAHKQQSIAVFDFIGTNRKTKSFFVLSTQIEKGSLFLSIQNVSKMHCDLVFPLFKECRTFKRRQSIAVFDFVGTK